MLSLVPKDLHNLLLPSTKPYSPLHLMLRVGFLRQTRQLGLLGGATTAGQSLISHRSHDHFIGTLCVWYSGWSILRFRNTFSTVSSGRIGRAATKCLPTTSFSLVSSGHKGDEAARGLRAKYVAFWDGSHGKRPRCKPDKIDVFYSYCISVHTDC